jgi:outer membrane protein OmpA-like peptidoglycan-associated protein
MRYSTTFILLLLQISVFQIITAQKLPQQDSLNLEKLEMGNFFSKKSGAKIVASSSVSPAKYASENIINDALGIGTFWRIANKIGNKSQFPHWVVIELPQKTLITTLRICTHALSESEMKGVSARTLMVEFSNKNPKEGYERKIREFLYRGNVTQVFNIEADSVKWVRFTIENNWDHPNFTELGRVFGYNDIALNEYKNTLLSEGKLEVHDIQFDENSFSIKNESIPVIENVAGVILENPAWKIMVEGHTDSTGEDSDNQVLSEKRAASVMEKLVSIGVPQERLAFAGFGETKPLYLESDELLKARNRRVTFRVMSN